MNCTRMRCVGIECKESRSRENFLVSCLRLSQVCLCRFTNWQVRLERRIVSYPQLGRKKDRPSKLLRRLKRLLADEQRPLLPRNSCCKM
ncbi:MAG: hypothetical protein JW395_0720 [Nitrospira sp.]|nr:hypothetical protein [Nitrospira sp.]